MNRYQAIPDRETWYPFYAFTPEMTTDDTATSFYLDPKDFPKRIELELRSDIAEKIKQIAEGSGRTFSEVATDILSKALEQ